MKKKIYGFERSRSIAVRTLACCIVMMFCVAVAAEPPLIDVPKVDGIKIDGVGGDWGDRGLRVDVMLNQGPEPRETSDFDAGFRIGWDDRGLLLLFNVSASVFNENEEERFIYAKDAIELFAAEQRGGSNLYQVMISPGVAPGFDKLRYVLNDRRRDLNLKKQELTVSIERTRGKNSYIMEALLPWSNIGVEPREGVEVGFQAFINNYYRKGRQTRLIWYPLAGTIVNTKAMHRIRLAEEPSPPFRAAANLTCSAPGRVRVMIHADVELAGKKAVIQGIEDESGQVELTPMYGRAVGALDLPYPLPGNRDGRRDILVDDVRVGIIEPTLMPQPAAPANRSEFGKYIPRTMELLATSTSEQRNPVKILFYGQSITAQAWWQQVSMDLHERYPYADLSVDNPAIGGFGVPSLVRTGEHDIYPEYPDLVVFHAYGVENALEEMVSNLRRRTTAEIVLWTSHERAIRGETEEEREADLKRIEEHYSIIRDVAEKYGCELIEVAGQWRRYRADNGLEISDLLGDGIHLNSKGNDLLAMLVIPHFRYDKKFKNKWSDTITTLPVKADDDGVIKVEFEGNRVDVIAGRIENGKSGSARVLINGRPPSENPGLYAVTLPSAAPYVWWPSISRVSNNTPLVLEDWTLTVLEHNEEDSEFVFEISGSETGHDGRGVSSARFVSDSGRVVIEPDDWRIAGALNRAKKALPDNFKVTWSVIPQFLDIYNAPETTDIARIYRVTLAQGLENGKHTLEIISNNDGEVPVKAIQVHCPPLKDE